MGRLPFESNVLANYQLAISAQNLGAANKTSTPTQTIYIRVDILSPQFWYPDYIVGTTDSTPVGGVYVYYLLFVVSQIVCVCSLVKCVFICSYAYFAV